MRPLPKSTAALGLREHPAAIPDPMPCFLSRDKFGKVLHQDILFGIDPNRVASENWFTFPFEAGCLPWLQPIRVDS